MDLGNEEIPGRVKDALKHLTVSLQGYVEALEHAKKQDIMFRGEGRYFSETVANLGEAARKVRADLERKIESITDPAKKALVLKYIESIGGIPEFNDRPKDDWIRGNSVLEKLFNFRT